MSITAKDLINQLNLTQSQSDHIEECIFLIKCSKHNEKIHKCAINMIIYKLKQYAAKANLEDVARLLAFYTDSYLKDYISQKVQDLTEYNYRPEDDFIFLRVSRNNDGQILRVSYRTSLLVDFLKDTFLIKFIGEEVAFWNGNEYRLGTSECLDLIGKIGSLFDIDRLKPTDLYNTKLIKGALSQTNRANANLIPLQNCVVKIDERNPDIEHVKVKPISTVLNITNSLNASVKFDTISDDTFIKFVENTYSQKADNALNEWANYDPDIRANLEEFVGVCLYQKQFIRKAVILVGSKPRCGKSSFCEFLKALVGEENTSSLSANNFKERFSLSMLVGKRLNIGAELARGNLDDLTVANLKACITGDPVKIEEKGIPATTFCNQAKIIFNCNEVPHFQDNALLSRFVLIPFEHQFPETDFSDNLTHDQNAINYLFLLGIKGLLRVLARVRQNKMGKTYTPLFTPSKRIAEYTAKFESESNHIIEYCHIPETKEDLIRQPNKKEFNNEQEYLNYTVKGAYIRFKAWCTDNGYYTKNNYPTCAKFRDTACRVLGLFTIKENYTDFSKLNRTGKARAQPLVFSATQK